MALAPWRAASSMEFDDDLLDQMRAAYAGDDDDEDSGASMHDSFVSSAAEAGEEESVTHDGSVDPGLLASEHGAPALEDPVPEPSLGRSSQRRRRGSRGGVSRGSGGNSHPGSNAEAKKRWRSGQIPAPPTFEGDIEADPYCLRHYKRRLWRWVRITREFLPPNEQALRAREQLRGEAELEFEEVEDARFDCDDGIQLLLADLEQSFGERELFRQGGIIREFEAVGRMQGESVTAFVRRFRLLERKLQDNRVPAYPEEARVVKLLDGLRLDERSTSSLLLAAGNKYDMKLIQEAIRIQYPPGMTVTGLPNARGSNNTLLPKRPRPRQKWTNWQTSWNYDPEYCEDQTSVPEDAYEYDATAYLANEDVSAEYEAENQLEAIPEEDVEYQYDDNDVNQTDANDEPADYGNDELAQQLMSTVQALTVTSKRLADITKARGFFQPDNNKGKGGGKSPPKGKGKGKTDKGKGKSKGKGSGKAAPGRGSPGPQFSKGGKGRGKPGMTPSKTNFAAQQQRLDPAACLACGSLNHWIKDCPQATTYSAQLASSSHVLDPCGSVVTNWMLSADDAGKSFCLPELTEDLEHDVCDVFRSAEDQLHDHDH